MAIISDEKTIGNTFTAIGCIAAFAAYDIAKRIFKPSYSGGGCVTRTGYYILMGSIAVAAGRKVINLASEVYTEYKPKEKAEKR